MTQLSKDIQNILADVIYARPDPHIVTEIFKKNKIKHQLLQELFEHYEGPFWSEYIGCELLDICAEKENILSVTEICRHQFGFTPNLLVLTRFSVGQVVILDCIDDKVYVVDFEGGDNLLISGKLAPEWKSFSAFLNEYFTGNSEIL